LNKVSSGAMVNFSKDMMGYLMKLEFSTFKNNSETVMNSFTKSMQGLDRLNRWVIGNVMSNAVEIVIVSLMLYALLGPKYFINTIVTYGIYMMVTRKISKYRQKILREKYKAEVNSENKIYDIVYNIETVKYFQREEKESENFSNIIRGVREKEQKVISSLSLLNTSQNFIISLGMIINLGMGIFDCFNGTMTAGDLVMLNAIFAQIIMPLNFMGSLMREIDETRVNLQYAIDMVDEKQKLIKGENSTQLFHFQKGKIEFQNVSFRFPTQNQNHEGKLILDNASVVFEPGTMNAIVGHSGQGKSTLFNLLYKLYDPLSGKILVDDQDISKAENDSYRKHLSICPQNGHLFNESIYYNILYGNLLATDEDIVKVTQEVNIYKKISSLSEKFQTNVGTLGSKLSGGERQRLLLARSFIKNSEILLLDEPTSNLDNVNENIILNYIHRIKRDKTILITAHR
jgi:ABC-type transport system involved in Fe-S cluster assembly fused permease/ATPase subunit